ncbi:MAG: non-heme iron oxygenase ferredoxin subunit [Candidatus Dormibacteraeota bacterium]|nr:non-heme iron oxygenase ferredoxin subunit [Candidatus Dormibacteraeota bacterium]
MSRHLVGRIEDLEPDTMKQVIVDGEEICLAHAEDGAYYAISDICTHEEFNLSDGELWGLDVECPAHGSRFNLVTGAVDALPATAPARTFPVLVEADEVYIEM